MYAPSFLRSRAGAAPSAWWERLLRLPAVLSVSGAALLTALAAPVAGWYGTIPGLVAAAVLWVCVLFVPMGRGTTGRMLWTALALGLGAATLAITPTSGMSPVVLAPLLATLPLYPLECLALLVLVVAGILWRAWDFGSAVPWVISAWAIVVAATLLRQLGRERQRADTLLGDCVRAASSPVDVDALHVVQHLTSAREIALLRSNGHPPGVSAVEHPFIWLQGNQFREETALVADGMTRLPPDFPRDRAAVLDLPSAPGSKLFIAGGNLTGNDIDGDTFLQDLARLIGLRESHRWMSLRLRSADYSSLESLVQALDTRDPYTRGHSERVARYAVAIGREYGLSTALIDELQRGGMLHDIGKIGVPEHILHKPARLTAEEFIVMQRHVKIGVQIIDAINSSVNVLDVVSGHHEHHNGSGYPRKLEGDQIPLLARIAHVADSFEAMTSARSYNRPRPLSGGLVELQRCSGTQFHPEIVAALAAVLRRNGTHFAP